LSRESGARTIKRKFPLEQNVSQRTENKTLHWNGRTNGI